MARKKQERGAGKQADEAGDDAIAILTRDHREVEALFDKCKAAADSGEVAGEAGDKTSLIRQICESLTLHATLEEEIFYPACREAQVEDELLNEAQVEHDTAKVLLIDLAEAAEDDPYLDAKLTVLREYIKHHVAEEEKPDEGIFARAQAAGIDLEDMGRKIQERRSELQAELHSQVDEQGADASEDATTRLRPVSLRVASVRVITGTGQEQSIMGRQYEQERDDRGRFMREDERQRYGGPQGRQFGGRDRGDWDRNGWERDEQGRFAREGDEGRYWDEGRRDEGRGGYQSRWESDQGYDQGYDRGGGQQYREQEYGNRFMGDTGDYRGRDEDYYSSRGEYEDRDERGRFMSRGEDRYGRGGGYYREESSGYGGRGRDEQPRDDQGRFMSERGERGDYRARGRDEGGRERSRSGRDQGRDQGGWFGEPRRHAEAARLGWRHRQ